MVKEILDFRDKFLLNNGQRIYEVEEVVEGNILGIINPKHSDGALVTLNYVERTHLEPSLNKFDFFPYAVFKGPYFGLHISENAELIGYSYISIKPDVRVWKPILISKHLSPEKQEIQREFVNDPNEDGMLDDFGDINTRVYLITEEPYKRIGNLISMADLPFLPLPQSLDLDKLVQAIEESRQDFEAIRIATRNIESRFKK